MNKPNFLFILSDDQAFWALGKAGNRYLKTPNLDKLAEKGIYFENFFCASPVCSPARASIVTGRIPSGHGVHDWLKAGSIDSDKVPDNVTLPGYLANEDKPIRFLEGFDTYPKILSDNGYDCALSGKWHLGDNAAPADGFSHWLSICGGGCSYYNHDIIRNGEIGFEERHITESITADAMDYLDSRKDSDKPFYLSVHYTAPHSPWGKEQQPQEFFDLYKDCDFDDIPYAAVHENQIKSAPVGHDPKSRNDLIAGYYALITHMDHWIGKLFDKLERTGLADNTIIVFTGDNGMSCGQHGIWGKGNGTFPQNMYDTAVKVPFLLYDPKGAKGVTASALYSHYDIFKTLLELAGVSYANTEQLPGSSFSNFVKTGCEDAGREVVVYDEYGPTRMLRTDKFKYIRRYAFGPDELYDLRADKDENTNQINNPNYAEVVKELKCRLEKWFYRYSDPAVDGTRERCYGVGQLRKAGIYSGGEESYFMPVEFYRNR